MIWSTAFALFPLPPSVPRQGIEPRPADSKSAVPSVTLARRPLWCTAGRRAGVQGIEPCGGGFGGRPLSQKHTSRRWRVSDGIRTRTSCFTGRRACPLHLGYHGQVMNSPRSEPDTATARLHFISGTSGSRTPIVWLQTRSPPVGPTSHDLQRSVRGLNPVLVAAIHACCQNTYRPIQACPIRRGNLK